MAEKPLKTFIDALAQRIQSGAGEVHLSNISGSYLALVISRLAAQLQKSCIAVVVPDDSAAETFFSDLRFFIGDEEDEAGRVSLISMPSYDTIPYVELADDRDVTERRMVALSRLRLAKKKLVCLSASALQRRVVPQNVMEERCMTIRCNDVIDREALVSRLLESGYRRFPVVDDPSSFAVRGSIVDVFPPAQRYPARIEFFDDQVERIRLFDPNTQKSLRNVDDIAIHPVSESIENQTASAKSRLRDLADRLQYPTRAMRHWIEKLSCGAQLDHNALTPAYYAAMEPIWHGLADDTLWLLIEHQQVFGRLETDYRDYGRAYDRFCEQGGFGFAPDELYVQRDEFKQYLSKRSTLLASLVTTEEDDSDATTESINSMYAPQAQRNAAISSTLKQARADVHSNSAVDQLVQYLNDWQHEGANVAIACGDILELRRLEALLVDKQVTTAAQGNGSGVLTADGATLSLIPRDLSHGFRLLPELVILTHAEIFGQRRTTRSSRRPSGPRLGDLRELKPDSLIVHRDHGVGLYRGLVQLDLGGALTDYMHLEYAAGDRLYLPIYRIDQVHRYVGAEASQAKLDRLGGGTWKKKKRKVAADLRKLGEELLVLYAQRSALVGHAYGQPDSHYQEFSAGFPFTETPDQLKAIEATISDLTTEKPMDRLICGDVGFGKTEVALRAAFLVATSGRQVAVLAPTTVLVEQHYRSFCQRLSCYPLTIAALSRLRSSTEQTKIVTRIESGAIDIAIGTHRILSDDVRFKDLGLLIVDEEQRFGVRHKERLKRMRTQMDVLTLSATPIPRTLQMSLVGIRDISVIATPPADRLAIRTSICHFDETLIADAIRREMQRDGQVFFVHNEVKTIGRWAKKIQEIVPEARIAIAHGQLDARRLENIMIAFVRGDYDILVCTTIIESGIDIPTANTMFVHRAERFGLSQLYQLRGRIGRSHKRAYCYLIVPPTTQLSGDAQKRLEVLSQFTELGSGFAIASYDLEIRGAGDLLGAKQAGDVATVGFETYVQMLEEAIAELRGEPIVRETDPELSCCLPAFIPDDYVEDVGQRLHFYKRLSDACRDSNAISEVRNELYDRYGQLPREAEALCELMRLKGLACSLRLERVEVTEKRLIIAVSPSFGDETAQLHSEQFSSLGRRRWQKTLLDRTNESPLALSQRVLLALLRRINGLDYS